MIKEPYMANYQSNLLLTELSSGGILHHHIIGWSDLLAKRTPVTASIEPQSAFDMNGGWGIHRGQDGVRGFLLYDRLTEEFFNPHTGERYKGTDLAHIINGKN
jgi:hypothetical protein